MLLGTGGLLGSLMVSRATGDNFLHLIQLYHFINADYNDFQKSSVTFYTIKIPITNNSALAETMTHSSEKSSAPILLF